jgi:hypothetical protein
MSLLKKVLILTVLLLFTVNVSRAAGIVVANGGARSSWSGRWHGGGWRGFPLFWPIFFFLPWLARPEPSVVVVQPGEPDGVGAPEGAAAARSVEDYSRMLAGIHARMKQERKFLDSQWRSGNLQRDQYQENKGALAAIARDERRMADLNGGYLSSDQIEELNQRLEDVMDQVQQDLPK